MNPPSDTPPPPPPSPWAPPPSSAEPPRGSGPAPQGWDRPPEWSRPPSGPVRAPSGSRYDQQGRNGQGGRFGWLGELLTALALVVVGVLAVSVFGAIIAEVLDAGPSDADSELFFEDPVAELAVALVGIAVGIPIVLWVVRLLGRRPPGPCPPSSDGCGGAGSGAAPPWASR